VFALELTIYLVVEFSTCCKCTHCFSSMHGPTLPRPCWVMEFTQIRSFFFGGERVGRWGWGDGGSATNLRRKAFDSCNLSSNVLYHLVILKKWLIDWLYVSGFWCLCAQSPTTPGLRPWIPLQGDFRRVPSPRSPVATLTSEPGYATALLTGQ